MTASMRSQRSVPLIVAAVAAACAVCTACGGGGAGDPVAEAGAAQVVALDIDNLVSIDTLAESAAREHGAPGENEAVQYLLRSASGMPTAAAAAELRAEGFRDVVAE